MAKIILTLIFIFGYLYLVGVNHSQGDRYFSRLVSYINAISQKNWAEARYFERQLDKKLVRPIKEANYPEYLEVKIQHLLSRKKQTIDTALAVANLYNQLGDTENTKKYLQIAKTYDPIRQDIKDILLSL